MAEHTYIHITNAALDEWADGKIILRGVVDPASFNYLRVADYQREILPESKVNELAKVFVSGESLPDIELGMRGGDFETLADGSILLKDPTHIIDGLQRITAGKVVRDKGSANPRLGCVIHLNTTEAWECERFKALNLYRTKLSSNVLFRNMRNQSPAVGALYHFTVEERTSVLFGRVCWAQRVVSPQLMTATLLLKAAGFINARFGPGRSTVFDQLVNALDKTYASMERGRFEGNVRAFFNAIDEAFEIRQRSFKSGATCVRTTFLRAFAYVLVEHEDFWEGQRLVVSKAVIKKLRTFPLKDPEVIRLAGSSGKAWYILAEMMIDHINSGKRTENRLKRFAASASGLDDADDGEEGDEPVAAVG